jgi:hypothetical protein
MLLIFDPLQNELPEWIDRGLAGQAIINVLVILVRFEPKLVRVAKEQQAEEQKTTTTPGDAWVRGIMFQAEIPSNRLR